MGTSKLRLTMACWNYDRTRALMEGRVPVEGIELNYLNLPVEETFFRMLRHREFDASEMSLSSYVLSLFWEQPAFIAIPVFPSRVFRHSSIFVNRHSGIREPKDLVGKRVGTPEFQITASVWIRGILADEYGVPVDSVTYVTGGMEQTGRTEKQALGLPPHIRLEAVPKDKTLSQMLGSGELDALYTARIPSTFANGNGNVRRLFEDYASVEKQYFQRTHIFPIMHTIILRRDVYERYPWIAQSLYKAFILAQRETYEDLSESAALKVSLPWLVRYMEETREILGDDFWSCGLEPNRHVLSTFLRYSYEQGLSKRHLKPEEIFAPESLEAFKI